MGKITSYPSLDSYELTGDEVVLIETSNGTKNTTVSALMGKIIENVPDPDINFTIEPVKEEGEHIATVVINGNQKNIYASDISSLSESIVEILKDVSGLKTYVTPQMYGAKADGVTDDTEAIQNALQNPIVFMPKGTYITTKPIFIPSNTELFGCGEDTVIYNKGTGWNKNIVVVGYENGQTEAPAIGQTTPIAFTRVSPTVFTSDFNLSVGDVVIFATDELSQGKNNSIQKDSTGTVIIDKNSAGYVTLDEIPEGSILYSYKKIAQDSYNGLKLYTCFKSSIHDLKIKHLTTGSGMYGLWINGACNEIYNLTIDANTSIASNVSVRNMIRNINAIVHNSFSDNAEFFYNTVISDVTATYSGIEAETHYNTFAIGRGNGNFYERCVFNTPLNTELSATYSEAVFSECNFPHLITVRGNRDVVFRNCIFSEKISILAGSFYDCVFKKGLGSNILYGFARNVALVQDSPFSPMEQLHMLRWDAGVYSRVISGTSLTVTRFDYACKYVVYGNDVKFNESFGTSNKMEVIFAPNQATRIAKADGTFLSVGSKVDSVTLKATGFLFVEAVSLVN